MPSKADPSIYAGNVSCDFETPLCSWNDDPSGDFLWTRKRGSTPSSGTGPSGDHTTGNGYYVYIESSGRSQGDRARLISGEITPPSPAQAICLEFHYHMFGTSVGTLNLFSRLGTTDTALWSRTGTQSGNRWHRAELTITMSTKYKLVLEGIRGNTYSSDIAVDDILYTEADCPPRRVCTVELDSCGLIQDKNDDFDWSRVQASALATSSGPHEDKSTGTANGYVMYLDPTQGSVNQRAVMYTSQFDPNSFGECATFWYHMHGQNAGTLTVTEDATSTVVFTKTGNQGNMWRFGAASIPPTTKKYRILIEGKHGAGSVDHIALDNFDIRVGPCDPVGYCDFERNMCGWTNELQKDDFDWVRTRGQDATHWLSPPQDHTTLTDKGFYMLIEGTLFPSGKKAWLVSEHLPQADPACLTFWLYMHGTGAGTINIYMMNPASGTMQKKFSSTGDRGSFWHEVQVDVASGIEHQVVMEVIEGTNNNATVAIDDVAFDQVQCKVGSAFDCDFEADLCGFTQPIDDDFDWTRAQKTPSSSTGPSTDHTLGSGAGYFIYIEASFPRQAGDKAWLVSPNVPQQTASRCLDFWYHMYGDDIDTFNVYANTTSTGLGVPILKRVGTREDKWYRAQVEIVRSSEDFQYVFEGIVGNSYEGDQALDDIRVYDGECEATHFCEFQDPNLCGYKQDTKDDFDWTHNKGPTPSFYTGPTADYSYGTPEGYYMYIECSPPRPNDIARLISPVFVPDQSTKDACWTFFFHMYGADIGTLKVLMRDQNLQDTTIFTASGDNYGDRWLLGRATVTSKTAYQIVFEATAGSGYMSDIAIDHVGYKAGVCPEKGSCDFEDNICTWTNSQDDEFDWLRLSDSTWSSYTGPSEDHTCYYMYIETSSPRTSGDYAYLESEVFPKSPLTGSCMSFWYHMYGSDIGEMLIFSRGRGNNSRLEESLWYLQKEQSVNSTDWKFGQVGLYFNYDYQITFEGVVGTSFLGDIAIDDISFSHTGFCQFQPRTADPATLARNISCNFEKNTCRWVQDKSDDLNWIRQSGPTFGWDTGPNGDHTTGQGYYLLLDAWSGALGSNEVGRITSRTINPTSLTGGCLTWWYHMAGRDMGTMSMYLNDLTLQSIIKLWSRSGDQSGDWLMFQRTIKSGNKFTITFEGTMGSFWASDMALDDISFNEGSCPPTKWCDFEVDMCDWIQAVTDDFDWERKRGDEVHSGTILPLPDKTFETATGHFAYLSEKPPRVKGDQAIMYNSHYPATPTGECLHFWYHLHGTGVGSLAVHQYTGTLGNKMWERVGEQDDIWHRATVTLLSSISFFPAFVGTVGDPSGNGDIAIDEIDRKDGACLPPGYCDFQEDLCGWYNEPNDDQLDFERSSGATQSYNTGPSYDHTYGTQNGYYVFLETSWATKGDEAWLVSEHFQPSTTGDCLTLWYHMYGQGVDKMQVAQMDPTTKTKTVKQTVNGNQGDAWHELQVDLSSPTASYQIVIIAVVGKNYTSDIAVDDLHWTTGKCGTPKLQDCDFELNLCGYSQATDDDFDWTRAQGSTTSSQTGPPTDHTFGTDQGYYVYIEDSGQPYDDKARLLSPLVDNSHKSCISFYYHMFGSDIQTLNVYVQPQGGVLSQPIWTRSGTLDDRWYLGQFEAAFSSPYQIVYEGVASYSYQGDIALDDLKITDGNCKGTTRCTFEDTTLCSYIQETSDDFDWIVSHGPTPTKNTGPSVDVTLGTSSGKSDSVIFHLLIKLMDATCTLKQTRGQSVTRLPF
ncbi:MAM and LDL-receptor class A domain-containing protein 1-like [Acanthaster planci]|uniref:MAM and LDL-receptor class A domain-containing protein 1-like n=1 Tax=Acanthaster planci TaxID=133434 RepID=A0A8B7YV93_ACAPL|nr:MAM and LDL-receptor class A domain-containing protein 1-like [Acanthaster planci]